MATNTPSIQWFRGWQCLLLAWVCLWFAPGVAQAQKASNWRTFRTSDGLFDSLSTSISLSPRGNIWLRHGELNMLTRLDGYGATNIPSLGGGNFRVYESRSGQIWSLYSAGLAEYKDGDWVRYPVDSIRLELQTNLIRQVRPIPLLPADRDHVFFLLSDKLVEFVSVPLQMNVIVQASDTKLERFYDMIELADGSVWITGARGVMKLPGPSRQLRPGSPFEEFLCPPELPAQNFLRPVASDDGGFTMLGDGTAASERMLLHFQNGQWRGLSLGSEKARYAWRQAEDDYWVITINGLSRYRNGVKTALPREDTVAGQMYDMVRETNGVFWLATSEGVARYAPPLWQEPEALHSRELAFHATLLDREGVLWVVAADGLHRFFQERWTRFGWPTDFEAAFRPTDGLYELLPGQLVISSAEATLFFDFATREFTRLPVPADAARWHVAGQFLNGDLCVFSQAANAGATELLRYDGRNFQDFLELSPTNSLGDELFFFRELDNADIWLGGDEGLGLYREGKLNVFNRRMGFLADRAYCLEPVGQGRIWCGAGGSLLEYDGRRWSVVRSGFERIHAIWNGRDGSVWVASGTGVHRFHKDSWVTHGVEEGLPSAATYRVIEDRRGRVWATTPYGLFLFRPEGDIDPPRARIAVPVDQADARVTLNFFGEDKWRFTESQRLLFSYRLDNAPWSPYSTVRQISFEELPAGKHRFQVKAMDRNWNEEKEPALIEFATILPWYREPRLIAVSALGLVAVVFFAALAVNSHWQLKRSYAEVERIVEQRTLELERANRELLHSQKMKALGTLAAGVAHDFNNILSIIKGSTQIIESNLDQPEKVHTRINRIKTVVDQGTSIVKAMLGLSRVTAEGLSEHAPNEMVKQTLRLLGDKFLQDVKIEFQPGADLPKVRTANDVIQQMLINLIINAGDALSGKGKIIVRTGLVEEPPASLVLPPAPAERYVFLSVQDFGSGIAPEVLPRIFEPFFTTKAFSSRRGTGLGLSMVYEFAKELGHGLSVESEEGRGSTFTILLPVLRQGQAPPALIS